MKLSDNTAAFVTFLFSQRLAFEPNLALSEPGALAPREHDCTTRLYIEVLSCIVFVANRSLLLQNTGSTSAARAHAALHLSASVGYKRWALGV
jgi:hypothetical protein